MQAREDDDAPDTSRSDPLDSTEPAFVRDSEPFLCEDLFKGQNVFRPSVTTKKVGGCEEHGFYRKDYRHALTYSPNYSRCSALVYTQSYWVPR